MGKIKYGIIHTHTDNSIQDSALSPTQLVQKAAEYGAPAVVLTDHGTLTGVYEFMRAAEEAGIKGIPGVEAYIQEDDATVYKRSHMVLIPTDYTGYRAIAKAVTASNNRLFRGTPCMDLNILQQYFGEAATGHGHVIATSACIGGILSRIMLMDRDMEQEIQKLKAKLKEYSDPDDPGYLAKKRGLFEISDELQVLMKERDRLAKLAGRKFQAKERALSSLSGDMLVQAQQNLKLEKDETARAGQRLAAIKAEIAEKRKKETACRQECRALEQTHPQWRETQEKINRLESMLQGKTELYHEMKRMAAKLESIFGKGNFYFELQYHGIPDEEYVMPLLAKAADELRMPTVACNDVHYADRTTECIRGRQIVQALRFGRWMEPQPGDTEYYIKSDEELSAKLSEILPGENVRRAMEGIGSIVARCDVVFPTESHLPKFKGGIPGESTKARLRRLAEEGISWRYPTPGEFTDAYQQRMEYELEVIEKLGYSDYLCIVQDFLEYGRRLGLDNPEKVGLTVGPGRGSALGSLVCYLVGITSIDPMKYGLLFERFLNTERVSMPDIDSDFETQVRGKVIDYVKEKYGKDAVCCILAKGTLAAKAAVRSAARVLGLERYGDSRRLYEKGGAIAGKIPAVPGIRLDEVSKDLEREFGSDPEALQIIQDAKIVEGVTINHSMHAAGVIISDNEDISDYVALMYNTEKGQWMSQCDMVEAEKQAHLMKMDFLGLRTLNIINETLHAVYEHYGTRLNIEKAPFEKEVFQQIFSAGKTNGVFQFESSGMKNMLRRFKPGSIEDLILLVAAYRPGPLQYLDEIIAVKQGKAKPRYIVPQMEEILKKTYGKPVYQEQIMMIAHEIAGFTMGEADVIRAAIAKKKMKELEKYKDKFISGLVVAGAGQADAEKFWTEMLDFGRYSFNQSHACAYAHVAYYTAYLKWHYPTEFFATTLNYTATEKLPMMLRDCQASGIRILPPDINQSSYGFTGSEGVIRFGLGNVKNVKDAANAILDERENKLFNSFRELLMRVPLKKNVIEALIESGALDSWSQNRAALLYTLPLYQDDLKIIQKKQQILEQLQQTDISAFNSKEKKSHFRKIETAENKLKEYQYRYDSTEIPQDIVEDSHKKLSHEYELLGIYLSGDPLEGYPDAKTLSSAKIGDISSTGTATLCGLISEVVEKNRNSDHAPMAFFRLADATGSINVCCFTKPYSQYGSLIEEGAAVAVSGKCVADRAAEDEDDPEIKLIAESIKVLEYQKDSVVVSVSDMADWANRVYSVLLFYYQKDGFPVILYDRSFGRFRKTTMTVSDDALLLDIPGVQIQMQKPAAKITAS